MLDPFLGIWQFGVVWAFGIVLERRLHMPLPYGLRMAIAFGLGEMGLSLLLLALGLVGGLRLWILLPLYGAGTLLFGPALLAELRTMARKAAPILRSHWLQAILLAFLISIYILGACVPEREVDSIWYHLGVPQFYIQHGGAIQEVPFNLPSHYPMAVHLHYTASLLFGNDSTAKFFILLHWFPTLILFISVAARYVPRAWLLFPLILYVSCLQMRLPVMANEQNALFFYVLLSTTLLWRALEEEDFPSFILSSLFCGMAMATKMNGLLFAWLAQWTLLGFWLLFFRECSLRQACRWWVTHSAIAWAVLSPWMIKSLWFTGNPFYPMLGDWFPVKPEYQEAMRAHAEKHGLNLLKSPTWSAFWREAHALVDNYLYNADLLFFLGMISVCVLLFLRRRDWRYPTLSGLTMAGLFSLMWGLESERLYAASYPVLILVITLHLSWIESMMSRSPLAKALQWIVLLGMVTTCLTQKYAFVTNPRIRWTGEIVLSEPARRQWLADRRVASMNFFRMRDYLQKAIPPAEELYGYRTGDLFYLDWRAMNSDTRFGEQMDLWLAEGDATALEHFHRLKVCWLLTLDEGLPNPIYPEQKPLWQRWNAFAQRHLSLYHTEGEVKLYRLRDKGNE